MDRIDKILNHDLFLFHLEKNRAAEQGRRFCRHNLQHFLDVARIGVIISYEERQGLDREWIYAAALLHDLGRHLQYEEGVPHEETSAGIARGILQDCGFSDKETDVIVSAILSHREAGATAAPGLADILYRADKASRACFDCAAREECNWREDQKNLGIKY